MNTVLFPSLLVLLGLSACGPDKTDSAGKSPPEKANATQEKEASAPDHGVSTDLGVLTLAGKQFGIIRLGDLVLGKEGAFEVRPKEMAAPDIAKLNLYLWVEGEGGKQLSAPAKGSQEGDLFHFHVSPRKGDVAPVRVVLRMRSEGVDERAGLPLDGHGHEHRDGPHDGVPASFKSGEMSGQLELKLHDDKGDLELWLYQDEEFKTPLDLDLATSIEIEFIDPVAKRVTLSPRNKVKNEDEDGTANVREGKTNYFIFPGKTGSDASWLVGKDFHAIVVVRFRRGDQAFVSEEFVLKPHVH
jgi:hypothetical protein